MDRELTVQGLAERGSSVRTGQWSCLASPSVMWQVWLEVIDCRPTSHANNDLPLVAELAKGPQYCLRGAWNVHFDIYFPQGIR